MRVVLNILLCSYHLFSMTILKQKNDVLPTFLIISVNAHETTQTFLSDSCDNALRLLAGKQGSVHGLLKWVKPFKSRKIQRRPSCCTAPALTPVC